MRPQSRSLASRRFNVNTMLTMADTITQIGDRVSDIDPESVAQPEATESAPPLALPPTPPPKPAHPPKYKWARYPEKKLLKMRLSDLDLRLDGTRLESYIAQVQAELIARNIRFRPHYWLSTEWFTPDDVPGIAISFFLAHPRLQKLEKKMMLEVEGGTPVWCLRILRHEVGHAIDNAFRFHDRPEWRKIFGRYSQKYPTYYQPKPYSKRFVLHLENWYGQSHPAEDFAETFAVWLTPNSNWRRRYAGWPAMKKLEYVDSLMAEIAGARPLVRSRRRVEPLEKIETTLEEYYHHKRATYGAHYPDFYDRDLRRLFSDAPQFAGNESAARFLRRVRTDLRRLVARWTDEHQYTIDQVIQQMIKRCEDLRLHLDRPETQARLEATVLLAVLTMNYLHAGYHRLQL